MGPRDVLELLPLGMISGYFSIPLFWLMMHPFMKRWRKCGRQSYWIILPLWTFLILAIFAVLFPFRSLHLYRSWIAWIPAGLLLLGGFAILLKASNNFSRVQVSGLAELEPARHRQQLITSGIRSRVRHPIYLAHLCEMLGWCVGSGLLATYALLPLALLLGALMIHAEDRELKARFGESYRLYRSQVPAVIPRFSR